MEQQFTGYYNSTKLPISINDERVKIGSKIIKTNKIQLIRTEYITDHELVFRPAIIVITAIAFAFITIILLNIVSLMAVFLGAIVGVIYAYFFHPKTLIKKGQNEYIKMIDIIGKNTYDTIIVRGKSEIDLTTIKLKELTPEQEKELKQQLKNIKKTRRFLVKRFESSKKTPITEIYKEFKKEGNKYDLKTSMDVKDIDLINKSYDTVAGKSVKWGFKLSRYAFLIISIMVCYIVVFHKIGFSIFF